MNKDIQKAMTDGGMKPADAKVAVDATLGAIRSALGSTGRVQIAGFGTFTKKHLPAKQGRNPRTGEPLTIAARDKVSFKASSTF